MLVEEMNAPRGTLHKKRILNVYILQTKNIAANYVLFGRISPRNVSECETDSIIRPHPASHNLHHEY
jgi:hypothetical protein